MPKIDTTGFTERGYVYKPKIRKELSQAILDSPDETVEHDYFLTENCPVKELQEAAKATVLISPSEKNLHGSGVIVESNGSRFLVTNSHVVGLRENQDNLNCYYQDSDGNKKVVGLKDLESVYDNMNKTDDLSRSDVSVYRFKDDNTSAIQLSETEITDRLDQHGITIGFPGKYSKTWEQTEWPLASISKIFVEKNKEISPYLQQLIANEPKSKSKIDTRKLLYSGVMMRGNSGGPVVDKQGKIIGICKGESASFGRENGITTVLDIRELIKYLSEQK